jgi:hypothetical protein
MMHQLEEKQETSLKEQVKRSTREISYLTTVFTDSVGLCIFIIASWGLVW